MFGRPASAWADSRRSAEMRNTLRSTGGAYGFPLGIPGPAAQPFGAAFSTGRGHPGLPAATEGSAGPSPLLLQAGEIAGAASAATAEMFIEELDNMNAEIASLQSQLRRSNETRATFAAEIQVQLESAQDQHRMYTEHIRRLAAMNEELIRDNKEVTAANEKLRNDNVRLMKKLVEMDQNMAALKRDVAKFEHLIQFGEAVSEFRNLVVRDLRGKIDEKYRSWPALAQLLDEERYERTQEGQVILRALRTAYTVYVTETEWQILSTLQRARNNIAHPGFDHEKCEDMLGQLEDEAKNCALTKVLAITKQCRPSPQAESS